MSQFFCSFLLFFLENILWFIRKHEVTGVILSQRILNGTLCNTRWHCILSLKELNTEHVSYPLILVCGCTWVEVMLVLWEKRREIWLHWNIFVVSIGHIVHSVPTRPARSLSVSMQETVNVASVNTSAILSAVGHRTQPAVILSHIRF